MLRTSKLSEEPSLPAEKKANRDLVAERKISRAYEHAIHGAGAIAVGGMASTLLGIPIPITGEAALTNQVIAIQLIDDDSKSHVSYEKKNN